MMESTEMVTVSKEEYVMLCKRSAELAEKSSTYLTLSNTVHQLRAENEALRLAAEAKQVNPLEKLIDEAVAAYFNSDKIHDKISAECEAAVEKFTASEQFCKVMDAAIEADLGERTIEVDEVVEKAIEDALQDVQIRFRNR